MSFWYFNIKNKFCKKKQPPPKLYIATFIIFKKYSESMEYLDHQSKLPHTLFLSGKFYMFHAELLLASWI